MKKIYFILAAMLLTISCDKDFTVLDKGHDTLSLSVSSQEIVLEEINASADGISVDWTTGTNYGTGNKINYTLEISANGTTLYENYGTGVYSWSKTVEELNDYLVSSFGVDYGQSVEVDLTIYAEVVGYPEYEQSASASFTATTYEAVSATLYIVGDATSADWNAEKALALTRSSNGLFKTTVDLSSDGEFYFICSKSSLTPRYVNNGGKLQYVSTSNGSTTGFTVENTATYDLTVDILSLTISISLSSSQAERFSEMYYLSGTNTLEMTHDILSMNLWYLGAEVEARDYLFSNESDGSSNVYSGTMSSAGAYRMYLDVSIGSESLILSPYEAPSGVWLVGDSTPGGWSLDDSSPMTLNSDYTYTWSGSLSTGELKFTLDRKSTWMGAWIMASESGVAPTGQEENVLLLDKSDSFYDELYPDITVSDLDYKWKITTAGTYQITLNLLTLKITIALQ